MRHRHFRQEEPRAKEDRILQRRTDLLHDQSFPELQEDAAERVEEFGLWKKENLF